MTPRGLKLSNGGVLTDIAEEDVWMLESRSRSRWGGMALGAIAPVGLAVLTKGCCYPLNDLSPSRLGILTAAGASIGALVGVTTTELIFHRGTEAASTGRTSILPVLTNHGKGLALSVSW